MRATLRRYSRHWLVHAIIVALAILVGVIVAFKARPTRGADLSAMLSDVSMLHARN